MGEGTSAARIIQLLGGEVPISAVEGLEDALAGGAGGAVSSVDGQTGAVDLTDTYVQIPAGPPTPGQVLSASDDDPLTVEWIDASEGGSGSGLPATFQAKTANYTALAGEWIEADATSAGFTVTLPAAPPAGALVAVKKIDASANVVTIAPSGGGTIDGDANATTATRWAGAVFEHKGSNVWRVAASMTTTGTPGTNGTNGNTVRSGVGAPSAGLGVDGDFYINTSLMTIYGPKSGSWGSATGMLGTNGTNGAISVIEDEGSALPVRSNINFVGAGVSAADAGGKTVVTIPGGAPSYGIPRTFNSESQTLATSPDANQAIFYRCVDPGATITAVVLHVWVSAGNISIAICTSLPGRNNPDTRVITTGAIPCPSSGVQTVSLGGSVVMTENHWFAISADGTVPTLLAFTNSSSVSDVAKGICATQASAHPIPASPAPTAGWAPKFMIVGA